MLESVIDMESPGNGKPQISVAIPTNSRHFEFKKRHNIRPLLEQIVKLMSWNITQTTKETSSSVTAAQLPGFLAEDYEEIFQTSPEASGIGTTGVMNKVECAAMWAEAGVREKSPWLVTKYIW